MRKTAPLLLAAFAAAGCGAGEAADGTATVWVTRDRGAKVLLVRTVPAGLTAMQALDRVADVDTRYGGRFVQAIDGIESSVTRRRDWFYFVNGYDADRGATEYTLHPGDVEWWDYRPWTTPGDVKVVVGAFPEPFLHGYDGKTRPARVSCQTRVRRACARLAALIRAEPRAAGGANVLVVTDRRVRFSASADADRRVRFVISARDAVRLAANPKLARFRYEGLP